ARALILVIDPGGCAGAGPSGQPHLAEQLPARLVEADHRPPRVVGEHIGPDHVLHPPDELGVGLRWDTPRLHDPGPDVVFFSAWRTVSVLTESARPRTTISSASSRSVQWPRPRGGSVHANSISPCST